MKADVIARNYDCLTSEERFRLILAASGRGDEAERDRLISAGGRIALSPARGEVVTLTEWVIP